MRALLDWHRAPPRAPPDAARAAAPRPGLGPRPQVFEAERVLVVTRAAPERQRRHRARLRIARTASSDVELPRRSRWTVLLDSHAALARDRRDSTCRIARRQLVVPRARRLVLGADRRRDACRPSPPTACSCTPTSTSPTRWRSLPYFVDLGVDWLYLVACVHGAAGSRHGYDVIDSDDASTPSSGAGRPRSSRRRGCTRPGSRILLDIVPNHEAATTRNPHWYALLRDGPDARRAGSTSTPSGNEQVDPGRCSGRSSVRGRRRARRRRARMRTSAEQPGASPLLRRDAPARRRRPMPTSRTSLERQHYQLAPWRTGTPFLNYRRFFDVSELAGVRVEDPTSSRRRTRSSPSSCDAGDRRRTARRPRRRARGSRDATSAPRADRVPDAFVCTSRRSSPRDEVLRPGLAGRRHDRLRVDRPTSPRCSSIPMAAPDSKRALLARTGQPRYDAVERAAKDLVLARSVPARVATHCRRARRGRHGRNRRPRSRPRSPALAEITLALDVYRTYCTAEPAGPTGPRPHRDRACCARGRRRRNPRWTRCGPPARGRVPTEATAARG